MQYLRIHFKTLTIYLLGNGIIDIYPRTSMIRFKIPDLIGISALSR